jgi:hypothetical protein
VSFFPTMFTKQVSPPVDSLDRPSWPRRGSGSSELEERLAHGPNPSFCALQVTGRHSPIEPRRPGAGPGRAVPHGQASPSCSSGLMESDERQRDEGSAFAEATRPQERVLTQSSGPSSPRFVRCNPRLRASESELQTQSQPLSQSHQASQVWSKPPPGMYLRQAATVRFPPPIKA